MSLERAIRRSLGPLPLISLILVACANGGDSGGNGSIVTTDPADLADVVWQLEEDSMGRLVDETFPGATITLRFDGAQASGSAGCNSYGGGYQADVDGTLSFEGFAMTLMACPPPLMALESAYLDVLGGVSAFQVASGELELIDGSSVLRFHPGAVPEALPLIGTEWTLTTITSGDVATSVISGTVITVALTSDDSVSGSAGCNRYHGTYAQTGDRLSFSPLATTKMACPDDVMAQESVFLDVMGRVASYTIDGSRDHLTLKDETGASLLVFEYVTDGVSAG